MKKGKFWGYIGGIIDGEGSISKLQFKPSGSMVISNTDKELLNRIKVFLSKNGVKSNIYKRKTKQKLHHSDAFDLQINSWRNLKIILNNCPIFIKEKRKRLELIIQRGETKEKKKNKRINNFIKLKVNHPEYSLRKVGRILNENLGLMLYRWGAGEVIKEKNEIKSRNGYN